LNGLARYEVLIDQRVERDLENVPDHIVERFIQLLDEFEKDPLSRRPGFDAKHLNLYSLDKENKQVKITMIVHRKKAYK
jgi:mRNA-degrading endonuclease RelE of RelBE toxin-antitoxin system